MDSLLLSGKKALIVGIANEQSIAYGCAKMLKQAGADIGMTYLNEKAKPFLQNIVNELEPSLFLKCDVTSQSDLEIVFDNIHRQWKTLDILVHSIAFAPKQDLHGPIVDCSKAGFLLAMDISCHSFVRMAKLAKPIMTNGGAMFAMSFHGSQSVVENYNLMGPVKAALESMVRYMAYELGPHQIRVNTISPGPVKTRAASGLDDFDSLVKTAKERSPLRVLADIQDIGAMVAYLSTDYAKHITGDTIYIDAGFHILS